MLVGRNLRPVLIVGVVAILLLSGIFSVSAMSASRAGTSVWTSEARVSSSPSRAATLPSSAVGTIPVGSFPDAVAADGDNGYVYVVNSDSNNVSVINGSTDKVAGSIIVPASPHSVAVDSANGYVYVPSYYFGNVSVISGSTDKVVGSIKVGTWPLGLAVDAANGYVYVANQYDSNVSVIDGSTNKIVGSIPVGSSPEDVAVDPANDYVYVTNTGSMNVSVINGSTDKVVGAIPVGSSPDGVAVDGATGIVYVVDSGSNNVSMIYALTDAVVGSIRVGSGPSYVAVDAANGYVYVTNTGSKNVSVINGSTERVVGAIPVGDEPTGVAADGDNGYVYVANYVSDNVSVIFVTFSVKFTTIPATCGSISLDGTAYTDGESAQASLGSDAVSALACSGYTLESLSGSGGVTVSSGKATVSGAGGITATFVVIPPPKYTIAFTTDPATCGTITFNGTKYTDGQSVQAVAGSYPVSAQACPGYSLASLTGSSGVPLTSGTANVTGAGGVTANFTNRSSSIPPTTNSTSPSNGFLGLSGDTGYYVLGGVGAAAVAAIAGVLFARRTRSKPPERSTPPSGSVEPPPSGPP